MAPTSGRVNKVRIKDGGKVLCRGKGLEKMSVERQEKIGNGR